MKHVTIEGIHSQLGGGSLSKESPSNSQSQRADDGKARSVVADDDRDESTMSHCKFADEKDFQEVIQVNPEHLNAADHDDVKLRNLPVSFQMSGRDPEAGVVASRFSALCRRRRLSRSHSSRSGTAQCC
jgi:hypothetical protein